MTHRIEKINGEIQKSVASIIREMRDPRIPELLSVTGVDTTGDLAQAKVYVSFIGDTNQKKEVLKALKRAEGFIRTRLGEEISLHYTPELIFEFDKSLEEGAKIDEILRKISEDKN
jgi:ribosome-binding factor A